MRKLLALFILIFATATLSYGQAISVNGGSIQGTITDSTGAALSGAQVVILDTDTNATRTLTTDKAGFYSVGPLNPGPYKVTVSASGFSTLAVDTVVRTGTSTPGTFKLKVGKTSDTVEVNAGALQINTDQIALSDVITKEQIDSLPVNGRNFLDLAQIEPGVILQSGESFDPTKAGYSAISLNGLSGRTTRILLDGQDITDETVGTTIFNVSQGAIAEFQLNRSTQDASGEVTSTGQVLVSTNSGTNKYHGQLFYNFQDYRALFAASSFNAPQVPQFQRNQFGGSVGGYIIKDKLFFFGNSERIKQVSSSVAPTSKTGTFAAIAAAYPTIPTPFKDTYSTIRLDYNGPFGGRYFVRGNYEVNGDASNYGAGYALYNNRDNTPGISGGADFQFGHLTHSFRVSYEKFHNFIGDATAGSKSLYVAVPGVYESFGAQGLYSGPNYLAPQGTFQSDKQFRYDGSWTKGRHNIRYGYNMNRIQGGGFAAFYGLSPYTTINAGTGFAGGPGVAGCGGVVGAASCLGDPANGYHIRTLALGNGQGFFSEHPGFGLIGGGVSDWREGAYVTDSWKASPSLTVTAGLRWSVDTGRANQDLNTPVCSDIDTSSVGAPCTGSIPLFSLYRADLGAKVHQPYANFGPQAGLNYSPGNHKTSIRLGGGIFYESDVFNNTTNARSALLKQGAYFDYALLCAGGGSYTIHFPDGTNSIYIDGFTGTGAHAATTIQTACNNEPVSVSGPQFITLQQIYQANTRKNAISANGGFIGESLNVNGIYGAPYRTPYSIQYSGGVQRELTKGITLSADYVHSATLKISQSVDLNHIGAARYLNTAAAQAAIGATVAGFGCGTTATAANINCAIGKGAKLADFANNGLDSGNQYIGGNPASYYGLTPATGAAFPGANAALGSGSFLLPVGKAGYDALQLIYHQVQNHPAPGIQNMNLQVSYSFSLSQTSSGGSSDALFSSGSLDNDNPNAYFGRTGLDRTHELNFGGSFTLKYGPRVSLIGHLYSAPPLSLALDASNPTGGIFTTDVTGDGTIGDLAPGTLQGDYGHRITAGTLGQYISGFNANQAGRLTPAGQALVNAGLFTSAQLTSIGATVQPIAQPLNGFVQSEPIFKNLDASFSYPIRLGFLREGLSLEPQITFYNAGNFANYAPAFSGVLQNTTTAGGTVSKPGSSSYVNGDTSTSLNGSRRQRGSGTFDQGAPRSTEFSLKLNF